MDAARRVWRGALVWVALLSLVPLWAQTEPETDAQAFERLQQALDQEEGLSDETKQAFRELLEHLKQDAAEPAPADAAVPSGLQTFWEETWERLDFFADLRFRHESNFLQDDRKDRHRERVRGRFGLKYKPIDEIEVGARLITGNSDDPNSPHQDLGQVFNSFEISLDRFYLTYRPDWASGLWATIGKFGNPIKRNPVYGDIVWDGDVQPEGLVIGYGYKGKPEDALQGFNLAVGEYIVLEQSDASEAWVTMFHASVELSPVSDLNFAMAASYYLYTNQVPDGSPRVLADNAGNELVDRDNDGDADDFRSDFGIFNGFVSLGYDGLAVPFGVSAELIYNTRAHGDRETGWALGAYLGKTKYVKPWDWGIYYQWQVVEQDAIFSPVAGDDFLHQTNRRANVFGGKLQIFDFMHVHAWAMVSRLDHPIPGNARMDGDNDAWRVRLDLNLSF